MLTGIELSGLILAVFPLLVSALEHYENGFQTIGDWIKFRAEFSAFMNSLALQRLLFRQNMEDLLSSLAVSDQALKGMLANPEDEGWKNPDLERRLRDRLSGQDEYEIYMSQVESVYNSVDKLRRKLKVEAGQSHWSQSTGAGFVRVEYEFRRFTYTLGKRKRQKLMDDIEKSNQNLRNLLGNSDRLGPIRKKRGGTLPRLFEQFRCQAASFHNAISKAVRCQCPSLHSKSLVLPTQKHSLHPQGNTLLLQEDLKLNVYFPIMGQTWSTVSLLNSEENTWFSIEVEMTTSKFHNNDPVSTSAGDPRGSSMQLARAAALTSRTVRFELDQNVSKHPKVTVPEAAIEITDLCAALKDHGPNKHCVGYIRDEDDRVHVLRTSPTQTFPENRSTRIVRLGTLLDGSTSVFLPRRVRLSIALTMARTLLQMHTSPWLREDWNKHDVWFFQKPNGDLHVEQPLLISEFTPCNIGEASSFSPSSDETFSVTQNCTNKTSRSAILCLGILIMELWFNTAFELVPFRKQFLRPDGQENEYTKFNTAQKWQEQALEEGGIDLDNVTRRCIYCAFGAASQDLGDAELRTALHDEVVEGLARLLTRYEEM